MPFQRHRSAREQVPDVLPDRGDAARVTGRHFELVEVLVVAVQERHGDPVLLAGSFDGVQVDGSFFARPDPEVAQLEHGRDAELGDGPDDVACPDVVAVPVTGDRDVPARAGQARLIRSGCQQMVGAQRCSRSR
jgi:hypothetical protein